MVISSVLNKSGSLALEHVPNNLSEHLSAPSSTFHQDQTLINISILVGQCFMHKCIKAMLGFQSKLIDITANLLNWHIWVGWRSWKSRCKVCSRKCWWLASFKIRVPSLRIDVRFCWEFWILWVVWTCEGRIPGRSWGQSLTWLRLRIIVEGCLWFLVLFELSLLWAQYLFLTLSPKS